MLEDSSEDDVSARPKLLGGVRESTPVLSHRCQHHISVCLQIGVCKLEGKPVLLHGNTHHVFIRTSESIHISECEPVRSNGTEHVCSIGSSQILHHVAKQR